VGALSTDVARERDRAGEQYTVLLSSGERPLLLIDVAWAGYYCSVWLIDDEGRRYFHIDTRLLDEGHLVPVEMCRWFYDDAAWPEFDTRAARRTWEYHQSGQLLIRDEQGGWRGGAHVTVHEYDPEPSRIAVPGFDYWRLFGDFLRLDGWELAEDLVVTNATVSESEELPVDERPWRPPRPLRPRGMEELFTPGTRYLIGDMGEVSVEIERTGTQHIPSGQVIAADPGAMGFGVEPFTTTVPPGNYDLVLAWVRFTDNPEHRRVAAAKLLIRDSPVVTWELALCSGQDPRTLGEDGFFGFAVDGGTGCFVDATATEALARIYEETFDDLLREGVAVPEFTDPHTGANLFAYRAGWGDGYYPTWIGRDRDGAVVCLVADMLIVGDSVPM
ncbi:DUF4241 domain-containing protein, partial [Actinomadura adrarensis]